MPGLREEPQLSSRGIAYYKDNRHFLGMCTRSRGGRLHGRSSYNEVYLGPIVSSDNSIRQGI